MILQVTDSGELILPAELVQAPPHTSLEVERHGDAIVLKSKSAAPKRFSIRTLPTLPGRFADPNSTFRREELYGDDGR